MVTNRDEQLQRFMLLGEMAMIVGMLIFPDMTQLDFTGPHEVISKLLGIEIKVISPSLDPVVRRVIETISPV